MPLDPSTGEAKYLKELNLLGRRKFNNQDTCANSKKSSKSKRNNLSFIPIFIMFINLK